MTALRRPTLILLASLPLWLAACIGGTTPPSQFYLLEPMAGASGAAAAETGQRVIALAPVHVPHYVDRPQIVTATAKNAYALSELHRWAERLDDNIARVLVQNLSLLLPADVLLLNASGRAQQARLRLSVNVLEFHVDAQAQARLSAQWSATQGDAAPLNHAFHCEEPASATDYGVMAGALNQCLERLSRDIAEAVKALPDAGARAVR